MRLTMRLPKRGFHNIFGVEYDLVNVGDLDRFESDAQVARGTEKKRFDEKEFGTSLKVLGEGELTKTLTVKAHAFSRSARRKSGAAGGKAEVI